MTSKIPPFPSFKTYTEGCDESTNNIRLFHGRNIQKYSEGILFSYP